MGTGSQIGYLRDMIKCKLFFANIFERTGVCAASCECSYGGEEVPRMALRVQRPTSPHLED